ncbi:hypothetical protein K503DRAFT_528123 [Rhizopogon vinicolor AM-OR11-026]|uniref:C2H2-type domain-containing protein n=1 Tax=Rhizopogon vinicolor AM-OR11-026 TaxID=1314800 RepID=A0A1B7N8Q9_9AGAM|nr:hypothetical protein K503DRAFT_528123 [Rhizopogon vinicolor AM-OR11-026]
MSTSESPPRGVSHRVLVPVDDAELTYEQSSLLPNSVVRHPSMERSQFLNLSEGLTEDTIPQIQPCISPRHSPCPPVHHQLSSPSTSQHLSVIPVPAEIRRGIKRRRTEEDDEDYQPHRTPKRTASSQTRSNGVASRKPRKGGPRSSKRTIKHEERREERSECSMVIYGCTKSFTRKNDMERHLGSCKFNPDLCSMSVKCPHCQKTLSRKDALLRHIKQSHMEVQ